MATREVLGRQYKRRRGVEFPDFMNGIVAAHPDREMHVVLDNLSAREPKGEMWLKRHKKIHFHYPPTQLSWLNQIEIWFSILTGQSLDGRSFTSCGLSGGCPLVPTEEAEVAKLQRFPEGPR